MSNRLSRYCDGVMEACWLLTLILTPLFFNVYSSRVFEPDKIALLRSLALIVLAAWLIKLGVEGGGRFEHVLASQESRSWKALLRVPLFVPVAAFVLIYLVSTIASVSPYASIFGSYQRLQGTFTTFSYLVMFAAVAANLRRRAQVERALTSVVITSLPISLYGIVQHYRLDPLPWGGDTTARVTANMGNAIFLAAYLIMSAPIVLGRVVQSFHAILTNAEGFARHMARATAYVFILAVNLVAIWFTASRGPWLGLLAGLFFFFVLLALHWRVRALALGSIGLAALTGVFLILFNVPNGPFESLRAVPGLGRMGNMFEEIQGRTGTGRVRALIWSGVVELMTPHDPLQQPDGEADPWNPIRPLVGYGPESLYVSFNRFYPPELGQLEARNATPDRSHNETFDSLAFTGLAGLGIYLALFVAVFYYALKWIGMVGTSRRRNVYLVLVLGGGLVSAGAFVVLQGPEFFGVGLPFGMLLGLIAFLTLYALRGDAGQAGKDAPRGQPEHWRVVPLIALFAAVVAHFTEIHFGIAIVSSRSHFWIFTGLMFVLGYVMPQLPASAINPTPASQTASRRRGRGSRGSTAAAQGRQSWPAVAISGAMVAAVLATLGFDYISNPSHSTQAGRILIDAFFTRPGPGGPTPSYAVGGLIILTWLVGGLLAYLEETPNHSQLEGPSGLPATWALSLMAGGFSWLLGSSHLASVAAVTPTTVDELIRSTERIAAMLGLFYGVMFVLLLGWAAVLPTEWPSVSRGHMGVNTLWYALVGLAAIVLSVTQNLQPIQADIIYKTGLQFDDQGQPQLSIPVYQRAIALVPGQDYYYLFLGRSYLNATNSVTDTVQREGIMQQAETELKKAQKLNPLNTDHTANLGRLNRQWAAVTPNPAMREERLALAEQFYEQALRLSPHNAGLWNEWALLAYQLEGNVEQAQEMLDQSFELDDRFEQTYQIQGDLYVFQAQNAGDPDAQKAFYEKAAEAYQRGVEVATVRGTDTVGMRIGLAGAYVAQNEAQKAIEVYEGLIPNVGPDLQWQIYRAVADLYWRQGMVPETRTYVQLAVEAAPDAEKPALQAFLEALPPSP